MEVLRYRDIVRVALGMFVLASGEIFELKLPKRISTGEITLSFVVSCTDKVLFSFLLDICLGSSNCLSGAIHLRDKEIVEVLLNGSLTNIPWDGKGSKSSF